MLENKSALLIDTDRETLLVLQQELLPLGFVVTAVSRLERIQYTLEAMYRVDLVFLTWEIDVDERHNIIKKLREADIDAPIIVYTIHCDSLSFIGKTGLQNVIATYLNMECFPEILQQVLAGKQAW